MSYCTYIPTIEDEDCPVYREILAHNPMWM